MAKFSLPFSLPSANRPWVLLLALAAGCQPGPVQTRRLSAEVLPVSSWEGIRTGLFGSRSFSVEEDLDAAQAATEGIRAVLVSLPQKERERVLSRWLPVGAVPPPPETVDLLTTVRGLFSIQQGSRDLALAAFFSGAEPVERARRRLKSPPERLSLEKLAGRLPKRELRHAREARTWSVLYGLAWPVERDWRLSSRFGPRFHPILGQELEHRGVDISVPVGTGVRAPAAGVVVGVRESPSNGKWLELRHEAGLRTVFCHLSSVEVKPGQKVLLGDLVAHSGETGRVTGPHLHYQVNHAGAWMDPVGIRASPALVATPLPSMH